MTWFRGKKRIARGADVTLIAPKKGKVRLRLVVRPAGGSAATRRITLRVVRPKR